MGRGYGGLYKQSFLDKAWLAKYVADVDLTIDELRAEVERLHLELERHQVTGDYEMGQLHANAALETEVERLRAEVERYRRILVKTPPSLW